MTTALATGNTFSLSDAIDRMAAIVLDTVSERSRVEYRRALNDFMTWQYNTRQDGFNRATVQAHIAALKANGTPASSINQRLAAIRKLAMELADNGVIDESTAQSIKRIKNEKRQGRKLGNWLTKAQAQQMITSPDADTLLGLRDRAVLAVMIGCGLRREEVTRLTMEHLQQRDGRWVILDLEGKHGRVRTVPMASWIKATIDRWTDVAGITSSFLFPPMRKGGRVLDGHMSSQAIWKIVQRYSPVDKLSPHDLRRTFAKMAYNNGASMEQIQFSLGHASIQTTEAYIGADMDLQNAPSDFIQLNV